MTDDDLKVWDEFKREIKNSVPRISVRFNKRGQGTIKPILDLHEMKIHDAYEETQRFIREAVSDKKKFVIVITGKSGMIRKEFSGWIDKNPSIRKSELLNDGGAFKIYLEK